MKTAVVYYSLDGSTRQAARLIAQKAGADVYELEEVKKRSGKPASFMAAAFGAIFGKKSRLKDNPAAKMGAYEKIYIGSPIWASRTVPALNTFVGALDAKDKDVVIFALQADPNLTASEGIRKLASKLEARGAKVSQMFCLHGEQPGKTASEEHISAQIAKHI